MAKVLVTGAAGQLGRSLVRRLVAEGHHVRALDLPGRRRFAPLVELGGRVEPVPGDLCDRTLLDDAVRGVEAIAHLAALLPPVSERQPERTRRVHEQGTAALIEAAERRSPGARLVLTSSFAVYGPEQAERGLAGPDSPTVATDVYTASKLAAEASVRSSTLDWTILRVAAAIEGSAASVDPIALRLMFEVDPEQPIELVHGEDVATAITRALFEPGASRQVLPIGGGARCQLRQRELFELSLGVVGVRDLPASAHGRSPSYTCWLDTERSQRLLGYQSRGPEQIREDLERNLGVRAPLGRLFAPLVRRILLRYSGPHRGAPARPSWRALIDAGY